MNVDVNRVIELMATKIGYLERDLAMATAALEATNAKLVQLELAQHEAPATTDAGIL